MAIIPAIRQSEQVLWLPPTGSTQLTGVGYFALSSNTVGQYNTALGFYSLQSNTSGMGNTGLGSGALTHTTTGNYDVAVGQAGLYSNVSGSNNTGLGAHTDLSPALDNATVIGSFAFVDASNKVRIGNSSVSSIGGQVSWTSFSDVRVKDDMKENVHGLDFIRELRPVTFHYNLDKENQLMGTKNLADWNSKKDIEKIAFSGFVAQEVDAAAKKVGYDFSGVDKSGRVMGLRYAEFVVPLVKAVQELSTQNDSLQSINKNLQARLDKLEKIVQNLQQFSPGNNAIAASTATETTSPIGRQASLEQNIPNPFNKTTAINYTLPQKFTSAQVIITDGNGKVFKQANISGSGRGVLTVDAATLTNGNYLYSLWIDGKLIATKQMLLAR